MFLFSVSVTDPFVSEMFVGPLSCATEMCCTKKPLAAGTSCIPLISVITAGTAQQAKWGLLNGEQRSF